MLTYTYVPEGKTFRDRYLVAHNVSLKLDPGPAHPQVKRAIALWQDQASDRRIMTSAPVIGTFTLDYVVGYEMTRPLPGNQSVAIDACQTAGPAPEQFIAPSDSCSSSGASRLRPEGWLLNLGPGMEGLIDNLEAGISGRTQTGDGFH